mmetsp:Transcript_6732/g.22054  ORF Transcript_6732/g.22054 Transcript_6732/m.22054 type:complete len:202 (+) Transcript_6732:582-1187(+)|eukprot:scaffold11206_cov117-Isochrysis_galbana.AAC.2
MPPDSGTHYRSPRATSTADAGFAPARCLGHFRIVLGICAPDYPGCALCPPVYRPAPMRLTGGASSPIGEMHCPPAPIGLSYVKAECLRPSTTSATNEASSDRDKDRMDDSAMTDCGAGSTGRVATGFSANLRLTWTRCVAFSADASSPALDGTNAQITAFMSMSGLVPVMSETDSLLRRRLRAAAPSQTLLRPNSRQEHMH